MDNRPMLNFKQLFKEEGTSEPETTKYLPPGWISLHYDKKRRRVEASSSMHSVENGDYAEPPQESEYIKWWLAEHERRKQELIDELGIDEYNRLYKYPEFEDDTEPEEEEVLDNEVYMSDDCDDYDDEKYR